MPLLGIGGAYATGVAVNAVTPARGGDLVKIAIVRTQIRGSSVPTIAASMGVVTLFDAVLGVCLIAVLAGFGLLPAVPAVPTLPTVSGLVVDHPVLASAGIVLLAAAAALLARRFGGALRTLWKRFKDGAAILGTPRRYLTDVVPMQLSAWVCRIGAAYFLLAAFQLPATLAAAVIVVMAGGLATVVPTPGGVGTQQVLLVYLLHTTASAAAVVSFSLGMQAAVTTLNALIGMVAAMLLFRTLRPAAAVRARVQAAMTEAGRS